MLLNQPVNSSTTSKLVVDSLAGSNDAQSYDYYAETNHCDGSSFSIITVVCHENLGMYNESRLICASSASRQEDAFIFEFYLSANDYY